MPLSLLIVSIMDKADDLVLQTTDSQTRGTGPLSHPQAGFGYFHILKTSISVLCRTRYNLTLKNCSLWKAGSLKPLFTFDKYTKCMTARCHGHMAEAETQISAFSVTADCLCWLKIHSGPFQDL